VSAAVKSDGLIVSLMIIRNAFLSLLLEPALSECTHKCQTAFIE